MEAKCYLHRDEDFKYIFQQHRNFGLIEKTTDEIEPTEAAPWYYILRWKKQKRKLLIDAYKAP